MNERTNERTSTATKVVHEFIKPPNIHTLLPALGCCIFPLHHQLNSAQLNSTSTQYQPKKHYPALHQQHHLRHVHFPLCYIYPISQSRNPTLPTDAHEEEKEEEEKKSYRDPVGKKKKHVELESAHFFFKIKS